MAEKLIKIDVSSFVGLAVHGLPRVNGIARFQAELASKARAHWIMLAQRGLKSSSRDYVQALSMSREGQKTIIELRGLVPNLIENGFKGGDMRDWLLKGPNAKMGKHGMYNTVPFRHGTPGTGGRNVGAPMPKPIYGAAKKLTATRSMFVPMAGSMVLYGQRLQTGTPGVTRKVRDMLETKQKSWHTTSIYTGMIREEKQYQSAAQSQYMTFRRISTRSDKRAWHHPGIKARHFADATQKELDRVAPALFQQILASELAGK